MSTSSLGALDTARILKSRTLAQGAHVDPDTLSDLLAQRRRPNFGSLLAVCAQLDLVLPM